MPASLNTHRLAPAGVRELAGVRRLCIWRAAGAGGHHRVGRPRQVLAHALAGLPLLDVHLHGGTPCPHSLSVSVPFDRLVPSSQQHCPATEEFHPGLVIVLCRPVSARTMPACPCVQACQASRLDSAAPNRTGRKPTRISALQNSAAANPERHLPEFDSVPVVLYWHRWCTTQRRTSPSSRQSRGTRCRRSWPAPCTATSPPGWSSSATTSGAVTHCPGVKVCIRFVRRLRRTDF